MNVKHVTMDGTKKAVRFENNLCGRWLVKNFSGADILVSFESATADADSIKIADGCGQVVVQNEYDEMLGHFGGKYATDTIYVKGTSGDVEVQQLAFTAEVK